MKKTLLLLSLAAFLVLGLSSAVFASGVVDLNKASAEEIAGIEGADISADLAKAIVDYRAKNGPFKSGDDLLKVPGMSNEAWQRLNPVEKDGSIVHDPDAEMTLAPSKC